MDDAEHLVEPALADDEAGVAGLADLRAIVAASALTSSQASSVRGVMIPRTGRSAKRSTRTTISSAYCDSP